MNLFKEYKKPENVVDIAWDRLPLLINLKGFILEIKHNSTAGRIYIYGKNSEGKVLGIGDEKLVQDSPVWAKSMLNSQGGRHPDYPIFDLVPRSLDEAEYELTLDNFKNGLVVLAYED